MKWSEFLLIAAASALVIFMVERIYKISVGAAQEPPPISETSSFFDEATAAAFAEAEAELKNGLPQE
jgi:hypothetical protein